MYKTESNMHFNEPFLEGQDKTRQDKTRQDKTRQDNLTIESDKANSCSVVPGFAIFVWALKKSFTDRVARKLAAFDSVKLFLCFPLLAGLFKKIQSGKLLFSVFPQPRHKIDRRENPIIETT